ncbi:MAG TPA: hypothetical protein DEQ09_07590 [Bacteroidales bacterium]|nr:hypothetical protein [Bacteroidales bacterium]
MPYRRLPNTDAARIRAMEQALSKGKELPPFKLAYKSNTYVKLQAFLPSFKHNYHLQRQSYNKQVECNKDYQELLKKAKTYINHFLRVMNMAVQRKDLRQDTPEFFGFVNGHSSMPALTSEKDIIHWGNKIMEGESARIRIGRTPITNPTMAVVKVHFENFLDAYQYQKTLHKRTVDYADKINELRNQADDLIVKLWNEVEESLNKLSEEEKRSEAEKYGVVYVFRKSELHKVDSN